MSKRINACQKGKAGERELAKLINELFPSLQVKRGQQHKGGTDSPDVVGLPGVHIECKRVERLNISEAMEQAERDCGESIPTVWHRKNREEWMITLRAKHLMAFVQKLHCSL